MSILIGLIASILFVGTAAFGICCLVEPEFRHWHFSRKPEWKALRSLYKGDDWVEASAVIFKHKSGLMAFTDDETLTIYDGSDKNSSRRIYLDNDARSRCRKVRASFRSKASKDIVDKALNYKIEAKKIEKEDVKRLKAVNNIGSF